jgi:hypothetical protein
MRIHQKPAGPRCESGFKQIINDLPVYPDPRQWVQDFLISRDPENGRNWEVMGANHPNLAKTNTTSLKFTAGDFVRKTDALEQSIFTLMDSPPVATLVTATFGSFYHTIAILRCENEGSSEKANYIYHILDSKSVHHKGFQKSIRLVLTGANALYRFLRRLCYSWVEDTANESYGGNSLQCTMYIDNCKSGLDETFQKLPSSAYGESVKFGALLRDINIGLDYCTPCQL